MRCARLNTAIDIPAVLSGLQSLTEDLWQAHVHQSVYQGGWQVLPLRCAAGHATAHPVLQSFQLHSDSGQWINLPVLKSQPALMDCLDQFIENDCRLQSARLMRLDAGAHIFPHRDPIGSWQQGEARLHFPIISDNRVAFYVAGEAVPMAVGECWYINAAEEHEVINNSPLSRVHLVLDVMVNQWLQNRLSKVCPLETAAELC